MRSGRYDKCDPYSQTLYYMGYIRKRPSTSTCIIVLTSSLVQWSSNHIMLYDQTQIKRYTIWLNNYCPGLCIVSKAYSQNHVTQFGGSCFLFRFIGSFHLIEISFLLHTINASVNIQWLSMYMLWCRSIIFCTVDDF